MTVVVHPHGELRAFGRVDGELHVAGRKADVGVEIQLERLVEVRRDRHRHTHHPREAVVDGQRRAGRLGDPHAQHRVVVRLEHDPVRDEPERRIADGRAGMDARDPHGAGIEGKKTCSHTVFVEPGGQENGSRSPMT